MYKFKLQKKQEGLTLMELLIALALGVLVILGISKGLVSLSLSSRVQNDNARLQADADAALSYISFKMRNALSTPCERLSLLNKSGTALFVHGISGDATTSSGATETINDTQAAEITSMINNKGVMVSQRDVSYAIGDVSSPSTDDITIISAGDRLYMNDEINYRSDRMTFSGSFPGGTGTNETLYAITDCAHMNVFRANRSQNDEGTTTTLTFAPGTRIRPRYLPDSSMVSSLDVSQILVDNNGRLVNRTLFNRSPGPLMDNVELIRVLFGVDEDLDGIADRYVVASQLDGLRLTDVVSADIYMMISIPGSNNHVPNTYTLQMPITSGNNVGTMQTFTINDRVRRQVFVRSVVFRNNAIINN